MVAGVTNNTSPITERGNPERDAHAASATGQVLTFIQTWSGAKIDFIKPDPSEFKLEDIAHALARICRFGGHTNRFYSVADHCLNVARHLAQSGANDATVFAGLLHDATEAYIGDIVSPLKRMLPLVSEIEARLASQIRHQFGVDIERVDFDAIKRADEALLVAEAKDLFDYPPLQNWTETIYAEPLRITAHLSQNVDESEFLFLSAVLVMVKTAPERRV